MAETELTENPHMCNNNTENLDEQHQQIAELFNKLSQVEAKLETVLKQKEIVQKEKEAMVVKYAMSEKNVLELKQAKEQMEKKYKEQLTENDIYKNKVQMMMNEKTRICQMFDDKCYEMKEILQKLEQNKMDFSALETKLKWSQHSLKTELQLHNDCRKQVEELRKHLDEVPEIENTETEFQKLKEKQANLILIKHEKDEQDHTIKTLNEQLEKLQIKQQELLSENNSLSLKIQQLECERLDSEQKISDLKANIDQARQDITEMQSQKALLDQIKLQLLNEQEQNRVLTEQISLLKQRNIELESDITGCREKESDLLVFTQQLTDKNVRLQSEFTSLETRVQQLSCEQNLLKRNLKESETNFVIISEDFKAEKSRNQALKLSLNDKTTSIEDLKQQLSDSKGETKLQKRKYDLSLKELNKELQKCRKLLETPEKVSVTDVNVIQPDKQTLIEHIVKLQKVSAKKSEKLDFLEEHVNSLVIELQKKTRLLQSYILRDQSGTMTSNSMDNNKASIAKLNGIMASLYSSRIADDKLTLELSLDINRKLQAVLEDALLKNITLKESVDTLGQEIERLKK